MAYAKTILIILVGCILGGTGIYGIDRHIDTFAVNAGDIIGGYAPLFSVWQYLFTGLGGIFLGGITLGLLVRRLRCSSVLMYVCAGYSIGIIAFGMPSSSLFAHSQQSGRKDSFPTSPFPSGRLPSQDDIDAAERLLLELYWAAPLVWSLTLTGYTSVVLWQRMTPKKIIA